MQAITKTKYVTRYLRNYYTVFRKKTRVFNYNSGIS